MPLQSVHQAPFGRQLFIHQSSSFSQPAPWAQALAQNTAQLPRGRKRSRDEAAVNLDSPEKAPPPVDPIQEAEDEWEYGPGMILIKKNTGYIHDASSQSGTWIEEKAAQQEAQLLEEAVLLQQRQAQDRPSLRSHKSSRLDVTLSLPSGKEVSPTRSSPGCDLSDQSGSILSTSDSPNQPVVDDFTMHLGIGWSRISDDDHIQAAARGWARYIENHYPVSDVKIRLESKGLESYLVEANEGFFLFAENLRQGRLVSQDARRAFENLKSSPPVFEGAETLTTTATPKPAEADPRMAPNPTVVRTDVSMDVC